MAIRVLVPNSQDAWSDADWATHHFLEQLSTEVDEYGLPEEYYNNIESLALNKYNVSIRLTWGQTSDEHVSEPLGWILDITDEELTVFILKWR
jgi:hypothetical protein